MIMESLKFSGAARASVALIKKLIVFINLNIHINFPISSTQALGAPGLIMALLEKKSLSIIGRGLLIR